jgi:hypothetical protein
MGKPGPNARLKMKRTAKEEEQGAECTARLKKKSTSEEEERGAKCTARLKKKSEERTRQREEGALLYQHAAPQTKVTRKGAPDKVQKGRWWHLLRDGLAATNVTASELAALARTYSQQDSPLDDMVSSKKETLLWPPVLGSVAPTVAAMWLGYTKHIREELSAAGCCCAKCKATCIEHKVRTVYTQTYRGSGCGYKVHEDESEDIDKSPEECSSLVVGLDVQCQGGVLFISRRKGGTMRVRNGKAKSAGDIDAIPLQSGEAVWFNNVAHGVTPVESGTRVVLRAVLLCPERSSRPPPRSRRKLPPTS